MVELGFVEDGVAAGGDGGGIGDLIFPELLAAVAEIPAVDADGRRGGIVEFDGVLERRVGVGEGFVDDEGGQEAIVAGRREWACRGR